MFEKDLYLDALREELVPALGCTEPIALAYAAAKAREVLDCMPEKAEVWCSGNIVKNVKAVVVPNSNGMKGIEAAVTLGIVGGNAAKGLEVLRDVTPEQIALAEALIADGFCKCSLAEQGDKLYIRIQVYSGAHRACVVVEQHHTNITLIQKDNETVLENTTTQSDHRYRRSGMSVRGILDFADNADLEEIAPILEKQITCNCAISGEGRNHPYGIQVWRSVAAINGTNMYAKAIADAAAASEARMCGCPLPVVINSGSGNQGITVCVPVVTIARELGVTHEKLLRALIVSNLISIHLKSYIGDLSAFCGAVTAACGAGAAVAYLLAEDYRVICGTVTNTLASVSGIVCDGAKASCAAKITASLEAAFTGYQLASAGRIFAAGDGLVMDDIEETIRCVGHIGHCGMDVTDKEILHLMLRDGKQISSSIC